LLTESGEPPKFFLIPDSADIFDAGNFLNGNDRQDDQQSEDLFVRILSVAQYGFCAVALDSCSALQAGPLERRQESVT